MRRILIVPLIGLILLALWLWGMGGETVIARHAADGQHWVQNAMAVALRRLKAGDWGALGSLWGLCFAYGFFHAAGPGHGKMVIGGYGLGRRVPMGRLAGLALASSLAQAATAIVLVYVGLWVLGWSRDQMRGLADDIMGPVSQAMIAGVGLWLVWRGLRGLWRMRSVAGHPQSAMPGVTDLSGLGGMALAATTPEVCATCGHAHGPTLDQVGQVRSLRDALVVVGVIAARPCTGSLFLLILTWRLGIDWAGIVGAFLIGLGTASITVLVAIGSVTARESALAQVASAPAVARTLSLIEILAGAMVMSVALQLLWPMI